MLSIYKSLTRNFNSSIYRKYITIKRVHKLKHERLFHTTIFKQLDNEVSELVLPHQCNFNTSMKTLKNTRKLLEKPLPLKSTSIDGSIKDTLNRKADLLAKLEILNGCISNCRSDEIVTTDIARMCCLLKKHGEELDGVHKDALDRYFSTLRNVFCDDNLNAMLRLKLVEVIELRAMKWQTNENVTNDFSSKLRQLEAHQRQQAIDNEKRLHDLMSTDEYRYNLFDVLNLIFNVALIGMFICVLHVFYDSKRQLDELEIDIVNFVKSRNKSKILPSTEKTA